MRFALRHFEYADNRKARGEATLSAVGCLVKWFRALGPGCTSVHFDR